MAKTATPENRAASATLSLKVTLRGTKPPVWRRILMPNDMTLADLHQAIQITMGWDDAHLHVFAVDGRQYGDPATTDDVDSEHRRKLSALVKAGATRFTYTYDFGDNWEHQILIEKKPPAAATKPAPACIAGKRHCPPEDCGGVWGYSELLDILANPAHPEYAERLEWLGGHFDPDAFSVAEADARLASAFGRKGTPPS